MVFQGQYCSLGRKIFTYLVPYIFFIFSMVLASCSKSLSGRLVNKLGEPIEVSNGLIHLSSLGPGGKEPRHLLKINRDGTFNLNESLDQGNYFLEALVPGFKISTIRFFFEGSAEVDVSLVPIGNKNGSAGPIHVSKKNLLNGQAGQVSLNPPET